MAGERIINEYADNTGLGEGFIGIDQYLPVKGMEFCHFFGSKGPNDRGVNKTFWDYSLNDRPVARAEGVLPFGDGAAGTFQGRYTLTATAADLGPAFTLCTLNRRFLNTNQDAAFISNYGADLGFSLTLGVANGAYSAIINGANETPLRTIQIPVDDYTKTGWDLLVLVVPGDGTAKLHVRRPSGFTSKVASVTGLPVNQLFSGRRFLVGGAYSGGFQPGDVATQVVGYSRAMPDAEIPVLQSGIRRFLNDYSGPLI